MNCSFLLPVVFVALITLQGCTPAPQPAESGAEIAVAPEAAATPAAEPSVQFNTSLSVKELMNGLVNPNARQLWSGVSYVETEQGAVETIPQTQEDWDQLRTNAMALIEASNALMLPGRSIDTSENVVTPDFQYTPNEIEQLLAEDPDTWIINLQNLQDYTLQTLETINRKDILGFTERGALINEACQSCHAQYWYKPLAMPR
jgi:hypothetical protein